MDSICGYKIIVAPDFPKMQCSPEFVRLQSPDLVAETNAWMLRFFGMRCMVPDGQVIMMDSTRNMTMSPRTFAQLRNAQKGP